METKIKMRSLQDCDLAGKTVLVRLDINSPIDPSSKKIVNENRIKKSLPTLRYLVEQGSKIVLIAHQGDTLDYQNLIPMAEHAEKLSALLGINVDYIDDVCGPAAIEAVKQVKPGEAIFLGNLRYLAEEMSSFETVVKLSPQEMTKTWLVRSLAPVCDIYVNEAFSAAHRACPSMIAFQEVLPTAAGELLLQEYSALSTVLNAAEKPSVFVLGGAKISDAFGMMEQVLANGTADRILTSGVTGVVFLLAKGIKVGQKYEQWLADKDFLGFVQPAKAYLESYGDRIELPTDLAYAQDGVRKEIRVTDLPLDDASFLDIGSDTIARYETILADAKTIFANGPAGVYEDPLFTNGTQFIWEAVAKSAAYSVIGGGDTVSSAAKFIDLKDISYVCTAGGAMVRFMTGKPLPLVTAMEEAFARETKA